MDGKFRRIGQGFCGSVWAASTESESSRAHKREDGGSNRSLSNDYSMHQRVVESMTSMRHEVGIPECYQFVKNDDQTWWNSQITRFPEQFQTPCNILITTRIPPFPKIARDAIVDLYCPEPLRPSIKSSTPDEDCLIRPYLGRRRRLVKNSRFQAFSLRNYPLYVDQMEELGLDDSLYARIMARTLAALYWQSNIDANDMEFVLAPAISNDLNGSRANPLNPTIIKSHILGDHIVWILDFDCCKQISLDRAGMEQAARAFYRNDPYYPRPGRKDAKGEMLWITFKEHFIKESETILGQESPEAPLPALWVHLVEEGGKVEDFSLRESTSVSA